MHHMSPAVMCVEALPLPRFTSGKALGATEPLLLCSQFACLAMCACPGGPRVSCEPLHSCAAFT